METKELRAFGRRADYVGTVRQLRVAAAESVERDRRRTRLAIALGVLAFVACALLVVMLLS